MLILAVKQPLQRCGGAAALTAAMSGTPVQRPMPSLPAYVESRSEARYSPSGVPGTLASSSYLTENADSAEVEAQRPGSRDLGKLAFGTKSSAGIIPGNELILTPMWVWGFGTREK